MYVGAKEITKEEYQELMTAGVPCWAQYDKDHAEYMPQLLRYLNGGDVEPDQMCSYADYLAGGRRFWMLIKED